MKEKLNHYWLYICVLVAKLKYESILVHEKATSPDVPKTLLAFPHGLCIHVLFSIFLYKLFVAD